MPKARYKIEMSSIEKIFNLIILFREFHYSKENILIIKNKTITIVNDKGEVMLGGKWQEEVRAKYNKTWLQLIHSKGN